MIHPEMAGVKRSSIKAEIGKKFKATEDRIAVFGLKAKYGGGRSSCFVTIYESVDARKMYDTKTNLNRVSDSVDLLRRMSLLALSTHCVFLGAFDLSLVPNFFVYTINRTKSSKSLSSRTVRWPRKSRARESGSEVLPSLRSRQARRRDEHPFTALSFGWLETITWRTIRAGESQREEHLCSALYCSLSLAR